MQIQVYLLHSCIGGIRRIDCKLQKFSNWLKFDRILLKWNIKLKYLNKEIQYEKFVSTIQSVISFRWNVMIIGWSIKATAFFLYVSPNCYKTSSKYVGVVKDLQEWVLTKSM